MPTPPCPEQERTSLHRLVGCEAVEMGAQASAERYTSQLGALELRTRWDNFTKAADMCRMRRSGSEGRWLQVVGDGRARLRGTYYSLGLAAGGRESVGLIVQSPRTRAELSGTRG